MFNTKLFTLALMYKIGNDNGTHYDHDSYVYTVHMIQVLMRSPEIFLDSLPVIHTNQEQTLLKRLTMTYFRTVETVERNSCKFNTQAPLFTYNEGHTYLSLLGHFANLKKNTFA